MPRETHAMVPVAASLLMTLLICHHTQSHGLKRLIMLPGTTTLLPLMRGNSCQVRVAN